MSISLRSRAGRLSVVGLGVAAIVLCVALALLVIELAVADGVDPLRLGLLGGLMLAALAGLYLSLRSLAERRSPPHRAFEEGDLGSSGGSPPLISLHQVPATPPDLVLDEAQVGEWVGKLRGAVRAGATRGLTISGLGGVGKTTLACALAERLASTYRDAQLFIDLRGGTRDPVDPADALARIVRAFYGQNVTVPWSLAELQALYHSILHDKKALIVFDDALDMRHVEGLLPPVGSVALITSRRRFVLPGFESLHLHELPEPLACQLLEAIAPRIADASDALARLCGRLPEALRAVGNVLAERPDLDPSEYLEQFRASSARLELAQEIFSSSVAQLSPTLRSHWALLGVMTGEFDRRAAEAVWAVAAGSTIAAQETLSELARQSMLEWDAERRRYRLHELARLTAAELARSEGGEVAWAAAQRRHARHYAARLGEIDALYRQGGEGIAQALAQLEADWDNIATGQAWAAAALAGAAATGSAAASAPELVEGALRLCSDYGRLGSHCLLLRQPAAQRAAWLTQALEAARRLADRRAESLHLGHLGHAYEALGQARRAVACYQEALAVADELGDLELAAHHRANLGLSRAAQGDARGAIALYEEALPVLQELGDRRAASFHLGNLGLAYAATGELTRAQTLYEEALAIARELGDRRAEGHHLGSQGLAFAAQGETRQAIACHEQALAIARELGERRAEAAHLGNLALARAAAGDKRRPVADHEATLAIMREVGDRLGEATALGNLGAVLFESGARDRAIECYEQQFAIAQELEDARSEASARYNLGVVFQHQGALDEARAQFKTALALFQELGSPHAERARLALEALG